MEPRADLGAFGRLRLWLAQLIAPPPPAVAQPNPIARLPAPAATQPTLPPSSKPSVRSKRHERADDDAAPAETRKRLEDAERRVRAAEERAAKAERSRAELAEAASAGAAAARADTAERALKAVEAGPRGGKKRGGRGGSLEAKLAAAIEQSRGAGTRAREAERLLDDTEKRARDFELRCQTLAASTDQALARARSAEQRMNEAEERASQARSEGSGAANRAANKAASDATTAEASSSLEVYFSPGDDCLRAIRRELARSKKTADICVFTITDDRIASAILDAHRRGVRVRIITDNDKAHDEGSDVRRLERAGIAVREDRTPFHMHHKFAVFDGRWALTGSYNWTRGAATNNEENLVVSDDARLMDPLQREFSGLWTRLGDV